MRKPDNNRKLPFVFPYLNCRCVTSYKREKDSDIIRKVTVISFRRHEKLTIIYGELMAYKIYLN